jgi:heat shock protein HslJ
MKNFKHFIILTLFNIIFLTTLSIGQTINPFIGDWKFEKIKNINTNKTILADTINNYFSISFINDSSIVGHMSANAFFCSYISDKNSIKIKQSGQTLRCCDSEISNELFRKLNSFENYSIQGDSLWLLNINETLYLTRKK